MSKPLSRREFLKILAVLPPSLYLSKFVKGAERSLRDPTEAGDPAARNVLVIVFDALSATNIPVYGYPRESMPNLKRLAQKATVYHNHYAGSNWTTPGTASLLTGTHAWTHRAFNQRDVVRRDRQGHNIFSAFPQHHRVGYSHNSIVERFLQQFFADLDQIVPQKSLFTENALSLDRLFPWDSDIAGLSWDRIAKPGEKGYTYSVLYSRLYNQYSQRQVQALRQSFPRGIPHIGADDNFLLEDAVTWLSAQVGDFPKPFLGYFHFLPPHRPYNTRREFVNAFEDDGLGYHIEKPRHPLFSQGKGTGPLNLKYQQEQRQLYDEFILYADAEFGRLYEALQAGGLLENTWLVLTSDHGELFERGIFGHRTPVLYQPVVRVPLIIWEPGQAEARNVRVPTSALDVLPTLLKVTGQPIPDWCEGQVLPPFADPAARSIYALEATNSPSDQPLNPATLMLVRDQYKLTYYAGYPELPGQEPLFELYDLENDPEELNNIYASQPDTAAALRIELLEKLRQVDEPYR